MSDPTTQAVNAAFDFQIIVQPLLQVMGLVITALIPIYAAKAFNAVERWLHIKIEEKDRQAIIGALNTSKGIIESKIDQRILNISHVSISNPAILAEANTFLAHVPQAAARFGLTPERVARLIVGAVDTGSRTQTVKVVDDDTANKSVTDVAAAVAALPPVTPAPAADGTVKWS